MKALLVVEDLPAICEWLVETARLAFPDTEVVAVARCSEGIEQAALRPFDVALVDLGLPDGSGVQVIQALRNHQPSAVPVVVSGEIIGPEAIEIFRYYGVEKLSVMQEG